MAVFLFLFFGFVSKLHHSCSENRTAFLFSSLPSFVFTLCGWALKASAEISGHEYNLESEHSGVLGFSTVKLSN